MSNALVKWWKKNRAQKAAAKKAAARELKAEARRQAAARADFTARQAKPASPAKKATGAKKARAAKKAPASRRAAQPVAQRGIFSDKPAPRTAAPAPVRTAATCTGCGGSGPVVKDGLCGGCVIELSFPGTRSAMYNEVRDQAGGEHLGTPTGRCGQSERDGTLCQRPGICPRGTHPSRTDFGLPALPPAAPGMPIASLCACCGQRHVGQPGEHCGSCTAHKAKPSPTSSQQAERVGPGSTGPTERAALDIICRCCGGRHGRQMQTGEHCSGCTAHKARKTGAHAPDRAGRCGQKTSDGTPCQRKGTCPPGTHSTRRPTSRRRPR